MDYGACYSRIFSAINVESPTGQPLFATVEVNGTDIQRQGINV